VKEHKITSEAFHVKSWKFYEGIRKTSQGFSGLPLCKHFQLLLFEFTVDQNYQIQQTLLVTYGNPLLLESPSMAMCSGKMFPQSPHLGLSQLLDNSCSFILLSVNTLAWACDPDLANVT
jgi:hypothetical protein